MVSDELRVATSKSLDVVGLEIFLIASGVGDGVALYEDSGSVLEFKGGLFFSGRSGARGSEEGGGSGGGLSEEGASGGRHDDSDLER